MLKAKASKFVYTCADSAGDFLRVQPCTPTGMLSEPPVPRTAIAQSLSRTCRGVRSARPFMIDHAFIFPAAANEVDRSQLWAARATRIRIPSSATPLKKINTRLARRCGIAEVRIPLREVHVRHSTAPGTNERSKSNIRQHGAPSEVQ